MEDQITNANVLTKKDLVIGTVITLVMGTTFTFLSSGMSLIVTFIPGLLFTWATYFLLYKKQIALLSGANFFPAFFGLLAIQFLHFAEEVVAGFRSAFPQLYGGAPFSDTLFVSFNMASYCIFSLACILVFTRQLRFLLVPALFFVIYGAIGNAISHTWWSLYLKLYFPGLITAQLYWIAGPLVLYKLVGERKMLFTIIVLFAVVMIPLLIVFAVPSAVDGL